MCMGTGTGWTSLLAVSLAVSSAMVPSAQQRPTGSASVTAPQMMFTSPALKDMEPMPLRFTQWPYRGGTPGQAYSPPLEWSNVPPGTNAFVLTLTDTGGRPQDVLM